MTIKPLLLSFNPRFGFRGQTLRLPVNLRPTYIRVGYTPLVCTDS
ncbi:hypothetical protein [Sporisorium scitamineum]|uniref:Uncharacterized protein n=1 Tax=Sporisorium scitamineum TaxID=49012 RepID=A0A0F7S8Z0_9BASI|nr:hypothetical protein [Sporisorium scitamineum]